MGQPSERLRLLPHARVLVIYHSALSLKNVCIGCNHRETWAGCIVSLAIHARLAFSESKSVSSHYIAERQKQNRGPTSGLEPLTCPLRERIGGFRDVDACFKTL
jgi:hypothetical protein